MARIRRGPRRVTKRKMLPRARRKPKRQLSRSKKTKNTALQVKRQRIVRMGQTLPNMISVILPYHIRVSASATLNTVTELLRIFPGSIFTPSTPSGH